MRCKEKDRRMKRDNDTQKQTAIDIGERHQRQRWKQSKRRKETGEETR